MKLKLIHKRSSFGILLGLVLCLTSSISLSTTRQKVVGPRILLLFDMEGISGVNRLAQLFYPSNEYQEARHLLTADVNAAIRGLKAAGAGDIVVIDGHGSGNWLEPDIILSDMDKRARMGFRDAPFDPYASADGSIQAIVSIGAHASTGKPGFAAHTRARISAYKVNGIEFTETSIMALTAMPFHVPIIMVSGDDTLQSQIKEQFPDVEFALVKKARGIADAELFPANIAHGNIERAAEAALRNLSKFKPLTMSAPFHFELRFRNKAQADYASRYVGVRRLDNLTVEYSVEDIVEGIDLGRRLTRLAEQEFRDLLLEIIRKRPDGKQILDEWQRELDQRWIDGIQDVPTPISSPNAAVPKQRFWGDF